MEEVDNFPERLRRNINHSRTPVTSTPKPAKASLAITKKDVDTCFGFDESDEENYDCLISPISTAGKKNKVQRKKKPAEKSLPTPTPAAIQQPQPSSRQTRPKRTAKTATATAVTTTAKKPRRNPAPAEVIRKPSEFPLYDLDDEVSTQSLEAFDVSDKLEEDVEMITYVRGNDGADCFNSLLARYNKPEPDDGLEVHFDSAPKKTYTHKKIEHDFHAEALPHQRKKTPDRQRSSRKVKKVGEGDADAEMAKWLEEKNKEFEELLHVPLMCAKEKNQS